MNSELEHNGFRRQRKPVTVAAADLHRIEMVAAEI